MAFAVVIDTVGDVARNALVAFTGFTCLIVRDISVHDEKPSSVPVVRNGQILSIEITVLRRLRPLFSARDASSGGRRFFMGTRKERSPPG